MIRRLLLPVLLVAVAVAAAVQANRADDDSDPGQAPEAGPPDAVVGTPLLSARRSPEWLRQPLSDSLLTTEVTSVLSTPSTPATTCLVVNRDGEPIIERRADTLHTPASLQKVLTAAAILGEAQPDETFRTEVVATFATPAVDGVLDGDIWIIGGGDPVLATRDYIGRYDEPRAWTDFEVLVDQVVAGLARIGATSIGGAVVADESKYDLPGREPQRDYTGEADQIEDVPIWKPEFVEQNQSGPLSALLVNDGFVAWPEEPARRENTRAGDPALATAQLMVTMLEERGIVVEGGAENGTTDSNLAPIQQTSLGAVESPPLGEIITRMLRYSDNTTAEMLFKEVGVRQAFGAQRFGAAFGVITALEDAGYTVRGTPDVFIADGSGLSSFNATRCRLLVEILDDVGPDSPIVQGMAVVGDSGTLRACLDGNPTVDDGDVFGKTGTLNDVTALAGMTVADNGDVISFALIANGEGVGLLGTCNEIQTTLIDAVAGHPYGPGLDDLDPEPAVAG